MEALRAHGGVELALLFGSHARGKATERSDVDVAVRGSGLDLLALSAHASRALGVEVDVVSLDTTDVPLLQALVRDGVVLLQTKPGAAGAWRARALSILELDRPGYVRMRDAFLARVAREGL